jgi:hypothetical protein
MMGEFITYKLEAATIYFKVFSSYFTRGNEENYKKKTSVKISRAPGISRIKSRNATH